MRSATHLAALAAGIALGAGVTFYRFYRALLRAYQVTRTTPQEYQ